MQISADFRASELKPKYRILPETSPEIECCENDKQTVGSEHASSRFSPQTRFSDSNLEEIGRKISESELPIDTIRQDSNISDGCSVRNMGEKITPEKCRSE